MNWPPPYAPFNKRKTLKCNFQTHIEDCWLSDNIYDYNFVSQGKVTIPSMDDSEEMGLTNVRKRYLSTEVEPANITIPSLSLSLFDGFLEKTLMPSISFWFWHPFRIRIWKIQGQIAITTATCQFFKTPFYYSARFSTSPPDWVMTPSKIRYLLISRCTVHGLPSGLAEPI